MVIFTTFVFNYIAIVWICVTCEFNPLTTGPDYIRVFLFLLAQ